VQAPRNLMAGLKRVIGARLLVQHNCVAPTKCTAEVVPKPPRLQSKPGGVHPEQTSGTSPKGRFRPVATGRTNHSGQSAMAKVS